MTEISKEELDERVAILRRLKKLLEMQRQKFREYLDLLEKQQNSIAEDDADKIAAHAEMEQQVAVGIANLQKVIIPMSEMYKPDNSAADKDVKEIQQDLDKLKEKVLKQNEKNRELLRNHLAQIRLQLKNFNNPYKNNLSIYAKTAAEPRLVEVQV